MSKPFTPRKFRVSIVEVLEKEEPNDDYIGNSLSKTIDEIDCKPIFDLLADSDLYSTKYPNKHSGKPSKLKV